MDFKKFDFENENLYQKLVNSVCDFKFNWYQTV